ncbi:MAG: recombination protein RecR [Rhodobiaceae bacterium]|nr:recombination protein RecR [Rhodobiaceae bacterium]
MIGPEIETLINLLSRMPGLGPRSARRAVLHLVRKRESLLLPLADALQIARDSIVTCGSCGAIDTTDPCTICADPRRDDSVICVVEDVGDLWALERAKATKGRYHVLGGVLSALDGVGPEDLSIAGLKTRCIIGVVKEVILATNATVEGQSTAHYIMDMLKDCDVTVSRLAHGVPVGGELDYLDDGTLAEAMKSRTEF